MDLASRPEHERFRRSLRRWLEENSPVGHGELVPGTPEEVAFLTAWQERLHRAGWCGITWPVEHGGRGATPFEHAIYNEEMARAQAPEPINRVGLNNVGPTLIRWGTDEQKRRWLGRILSAEDIWCQLFSEPDAGSDLAALRTRAERDGDAYRLTGQKVWTSYAHFSRWAICLARTDAVAAKHAGITYFVVDMTASGITIRPLRQLTGSAEFNEVFLDAVAVPRDQVIGRENDGWTVAVSTLAHERGTGYLFKEQVKARIAVERLIERVRRRRDGADPVHPLLRQEVARAFIGVEVLRTLNLDTLSRLARGHEPGAESSLKKEFWSRLTQQLHDTAMAIDGTASQLAAGDTRAIDGGRWPAAYLFSRAATIAGGTSEIQLDVIARRLLGLPRR